MKITRDVITDLLPLYLSGEASPDTQALVAEFLRDDPQFAAGIRQPAAPFPAQAGGRLSAAVEMKALQATRRLLRRRSFALAFAIFFCLFTVAIRFDTRGVFWLWSDMPILGLVFLGLGGLSAAIYWRLSRQLTGSSL